MCYNVPWFDRFFQLEVLLMWAKRCVSLLLAAALALSLAGCGANGDNSKGKGGAMTIAPAQRRRGRENFSLSPTAVYGIINVPITVRRPAACLGGNAVNIHESAENYLEAILALGEKGPVRSIDVAQHLGFSKPSA